MKNYIGAIVRHNAFGLGSIINQDDNSITVEFDGKTTRFTPEVFDNHLAFVDKALQNEVIELLSAAKAAQRAEIIAARKSEAEAAATAKAAKSNRKRSSAVVLGSDLACVQCVGDAAHKIYDACCNAFGWDSSKRGFFCRQKSLYFADATPEHYGAWFIANSNITGTKRGKWSNIISPDGKTISVVWDKIGDGFFINENKLVVFGKKADSLYYFLGIFVCTDINKDNRTKTYRLISDTYIPVISNAARNAAV